MTPEEAKAQYKRALSSLLYSCGLGDLNAIEDSVKTLDAAVCDFGLAAVETVGHKPRNPLTEQGIEDTLAGKHDEANCSACRAKAEINRGFGKVLEEPK